MPKTYHNSGSKSATCAKLFKTKARIQGQIATIQIFWLLYTMIIITGYFMLSSTEFLVGIISTGLFLVIVMALTHFSTSDASDVQIELRFFTEEEIIHEVSEALEEIPLLRRKRLEAIFAPITYSYKLLRWLYSILRWW